MTLTFDLVNGKLAHRFTEDLKTILTPLSHLLSS